MHHHVFEGTWEEVSKETAKLHANDRVRLEVIDQHPSKMIRYGMFPQLLSLSDDDFRQAQWRAPRSE